MTTSTPNFDNNFNFNFYIFFSFSLPTIFLSKNFILRFSYLEYFNSKNVFLGYTGTFSSQKEETMLVGTSS